MSLNIEKQSLPTLREWVKLLGIKGTSTFRKPELIALLKKAGEDRIAYVLRQKSAAMPEKAEAAFPDEPIRTEAVQETASEEPNEAAEERRFTRLKRNTEHRFVKPAAVSRSREEEPAGEQKSGGIRQKYNSISFSSRNESGREPQTGRTELPPRMTGRGGFGTYSPSYRPQAAAAEKPRYFAREDYSIRDTERPEKDEPSPLLEDYLDIEDSPEIDVSLLRGLSEKRPESEQEASPYVRGREHREAEQNGDPAGGILEVLPEGYGFIRCENYLPGDNDVYVSPAQIHRFHLRTGDMLSGYARLRTGTEKYPALSYIKTINDEDPETAARRKPFEELTPIFPNERIHLETVPEERAMRIMDLLSPIGKGQRGMIVSPPKAGKTTLLKAVAKAITRNHPEMKLIILLIDERPEEVTDIKESLEGRGVEVIYSTFDETPEHHKRVAEMVLGRAQCLVEHGHDAIILLDSITRLSRAYNLTVAPSGRTLSGGLDPAALNMPKKFFGAARNMREGGSLTVLATALVETGSRLDDMVFEEFKGTGNMELVLNRRLSERRIFPAIDILRSGTRRDDLLLDDEEMECVAMIRQAISSPTKGEEAAESILDLMRHTRTNREFCALVRKMNFMS